MLSLGGSPRSASLCPAERLSARICDAISNSERAQPTIQVAESHGPLCPRPEMPLLTAQARRLYAHSH